MDEQIRAYAGICSDFAERYARGSRARRVGAEYDDLNQIGLISVWMALRAGKTPSVVLIEFAMRDYMKNLGRQNPVPYEELLPFDDYRIGA